MTILRLQIPIILIHLSTISQAAIVINNQDSKISYSGQWTHWKRGDADTSQIETAIGGPVPNNLSTVSFTNATNSLATLNFQGTFVSIQSIRVNIGGSLTVTLDDRPPQPIDLNGAGNIPETVWNSPQLSNGAHSLSVGSSSKPLANYVNLISFSVEQSSDPLPGTSPANLQSTRGGMNVNPSQPTSPVSSPPTNPFTSASGFISDQIPSPLSSLQGSTPLFSSTPSSSPGNVPQNITVTHSVPGSTATAYIAPSPPAPLVSRSVRSSMPILFGSIGGITALILFGIVILRLRRSRRERKLFSGKIHQTTSYMSEVVKLPQTKQKCRLPYKIELGSTTSQESMAGATDIVDGKTKDAEHRLSPLTCVYRLSQAEKALLLLRAAKLNRRRRETSRIQAIEGPNHLSDPIFDDSPASTPPFLLDSDHGLSGAIHPNTISKNGVSQLEEVEQLRTQMAAMQATIETQARHLSLVQRIAIQGQRGESDAGTESLPPYASN